MWFSRVLTLKMYGIKVYKIKINIKKYKKIYKKNIKNKKNKKNGNVR